MKKINLAIFLSGTGTNFLSLSKACLDPDYPAEIKLVISDRECIGYKLSKKLKYKTILIKHLNNAFDFEKKATHLLKKNHVDLICLAGFMKILSPEFVNNWKNKILNIHPSILPLFPGLGTHKKAIASGMKIHGSTVHVVDENLDSGPIIGQCAINIKSKDNKKQIEERLKKYENILYVKSLEKYIKTFHNAENKNSLKKVEKEYNKVIFSI